MKEEHIINTELGNFVCKQEGDKLTDLRPTEVPFSNSTALSKLAKTVQSQLTEYIKGDRKTFDIPIKLNGTDFQVAVWKTIIEQVNYGEITTYSDVADMAGYPKASRAVGNALNKTPILIIIPCHRVVAKNHPGKYKYGMNMKKRLLEIEQSNIDK
jgi:O-6-methylguanine DNA methyltransferase